MLKNSLIHLFWLEGRILWIVKWRWWAAGNSEDKDRPQSSWDVPHSFLEQHSFLCHLYLSSAGHALPHPYSCHTHPIAYGAVIYTRRPLLTNLPLQLAWDIKSGKMEMLNKLLLCVCICMYRCVWTHTCLHREDENLGCPFFFFETGCLTDLDLTKWAKLAGQ